MGNWSGVDEVLPSLGLPAFSSGATMMSMPQAAPSAYPGLQGLWGPVTHAPPAGGISICPGRMLLHGDMVLHVHP